MSSFTDKVVKSAVLIFCCLAQFAHLDNNVDIYCFYLTNFSHEIERELETNIRSQSMEKSTAGTVKQTITGDDPIIGILNMNKWYEEFHVLKRGKKGDVRAESAIHISALVRFNTYAKISQIRCPRNFASCHGSGYRTKKDIY